LTNFQQQFLPSNSSRPLLLTSYDIRLSLHKSPRGWRKNCLSLPGYARTTRNTAWQR